MTPTFVANVVHQHLSVWLVLQVPKLRDASISVYAHILLHLNKPTYSTFKCFKKEFHLNNDSWWHVFPSISFDSLHMLPPHLRTLVSSNTIEPSSILPVGTQSKATCAAHGCKRVRVNRKCPRLMCREHCLLQRVGGSCSVHGVRNSLTPQREQQCEATPLMSISTVAPPISTHSLRTATEVIASTAGPTTVTPPCHVVAMQSPDLAVEPIRFPVSISPTQHRSLPPPGDVTNRPRITTQMNPIWMAEYLKTPTSTDVQTLGRPRAQKDLTSVRRFFLIYWDNNDDPASIRLIQDCPNWPMWQLTITQRDSMGADITSIQTYSVNHHIWVDVSLNHTHHLTTDCAVLIKRKGIHGVDEHEQIDRFVSPPIRRFRQGFSDERAILRQKLKNRPRLVVDCQDQDSDIEIPEGSPTKHYQDHDVQIANRAKRRRVDRSTDGSSSPPSSPVTVSPVQDSFPGTHTLIPTLPKPLHPSRRWPADWYAIDIVNGFKAVDDGAPHGKESSESMMARVNRIYGCNIPYSTFNDQRNRWRRAPQSLREEVLAVGRTPSGLWSNLVRSVRLKIVP